MTTARRCATRMALIAGPLTVLLIQTAGKYIP